MRGMVEDAYTGPSYTDRDPREIFYVYVSSICSLGYKWSVGGTGTPVLPGGYPVLPTEGGGGCGRSAEANLKTYSRCTMMWWQTLCFRWAIHTCTQPNLLGRLGCCCVQSPVRVAGTASIAR